MGDNSLAPGEVDWILANLGYVSEFTNHNVFIVDDSPRTSYLVSLGAISVFYLV